MPLIADGEQVIIIGKRVTSEDYAELADRIGPDEMAIEVPQHLVEEWLKSHSSDTTDN